MFWVFFNKKNGPEPVTSAISLLLCASGLGHALLILKELLGSSPFFVNPVPGPMKKQA